MNAKVILAPRTQTARMLKALSHAHVELDLLEMDTLARTSMNAKTSPYLVMKMQFVQILKDLMIVLVNLDTQETERPVLVCYTFIGYTILVIHFIWYLYNYIVTIVKLMQQSFRIYQQQDNQMTLAKPFVNFLVRFCTTFYKQL